LGLALAAACAAPIWGGGGTSRLLSRAAWAEEDGQGDEERQPGTPPKEKDAGDAGKDSAPPEGVRRQRPQTAQEERQYKVRKTREDPFLNPDAAAGQPAKQKDYFDPAAYLQPVSRGYTARYLVQNQQGQAVGYLSIGVALQSEQSRNDTLLVTKLLSVEPRTEVKLTLDARTLKPRQLIRTTLRSAGSAATVTQPSSADASPAGQQGGEPRGPAGEATAQTGGPAWSPEQEPPRQRADYLFDRVTILQSSGAISVRKVLRQLPFSYDAESLPIVLRQLTLAKVDWPFEAALTDTNRALSLPLAIEQPAYAQVLSAEPQDYRCYALVVHAGSSRSKYYLQTVSPYKLVKFTDGVYTYTLFEYASH
jgi:hypothetical protein